MPVAYELEILGLDEQLEKLKRFSAIADPELMRAMGQSVISIRNEVVPLTPVGVNSRLIDSIASQVTHEGPLSIVGRVGSTLKGEIYPEVMEFGRKPGRMPPPSALERWVHIVLKVEDKEAAGVAFRVARAIGRRGIKGKFFMKRGWEKARPAVLRYFETALNRIAEGLSNGRI
jgi:hypothetical protein